MPDRRYQTIGARFVASVIDTIVFLPLILAWYLIDPIEILQWLLGCGMFVVSTAYFVLLHGRDGQTLGKRLMNVRVVRANDEYRISYRQSMWRESPWITINAALLTIEAFRARIINPQRLARSTMRLMLFLTAGLLVIVRRLF